MSYAHKINPMYELCSYYDNGFIIDELCYIISSMTFIMTPTDQGQEKSIYITYPHYAVVKLFKKSNIHWYFEFFNKTYTVKDKSKDRVEKCLLFIFKCL